ncbi:serine-threonine protein phosphatase [Lactobacillus hamsteri DSM 5661 = JCM 6256]|uniref:Serine-threonine protein phosphatase n=1 Tax=Lactobacillus hamsteri DSM 5661 = JCM 6256 TaxID=1423754 RepID=A0A0R1YEL5_9LACO|nr:serine-threonine protein phosphatase [Lactobacillus hamsteri DSM 5661 = JCM 6256]
MYLLKGALTLAKLINQTLKSCKDTDKYIFISDIHGNEETLKLIDQAREDFPNALLVTGGDYIDGRNNVKDVLDYLIRARDEGAIVLKGNHEQMLLNYAEHKEHQDGIWFYNSGADTLKQLFNEVVSPKVVQQSKYYKFLSELPIMYETPQFIFVHAGIHCDKNYDDPSNYATELNIARHQYTYDFFRIWARQDYWYNHRDEPVFAHNLTNKTIITGHTPTSAISGQYDDGRSVNASILNPVRTIQYDGEAARIFTDGGSHSDPKIYPHNDGNVVVLNSDGTIEHTYNYENTLKQ